MSNINALNECWPLNPKNNTRYLTIATQDESLVILSFNLETNKFAVECSEFTEYHSKVMISAMDAMNIEVQRLMSVKHHEYSFNSFLNYYLLQIHHAIATCTFSTLRSFLSMFFIRIAGLQPIENSRGRVMMAVQKACIVRNWIWINTTTFHKNLSK